MIQNKMFNNFKLDNNIILIIGLVGGFIISNLPYKIILVLSISGILNVLSFIIIEILISFEDGLNNLQILSVSTNNNMKCLIITMSNPNNMDGEELFASIYNSLMNSEDFINFSYQKIIILSCGLVSGKEHNLHSNILICNDTTFKDYYYYLSKELSNYNNLQYGYNNESINKFIVKVWNADNLKDLKIKQTYSAILSPLRKHDAAVRSRYFKIHHKHPKNFGVKSFSTSAPLLSNKKWSAGLITPLSLYNKVGELKLKHPKAFFTMDLETINFNNTQIPIAISSCGYLNDKIDSKLFLIDHFLLQRNSEQALKELWSKYFTYLETVFKTDTLMGSKEKLTIFAHNLGDFDGYFLYKGLLHNYNPETISTIIDDTNSFISIKLLNQFSIEWKDSLRIFPVSLDKLCNMFGVEGKVTSYNPKYQTVELFNNPKLLFSFKKYSLQDSISLFNALLSAQSIYFDKFKIDIESVYSTATLSLKIFRSKFQNKIIPILPQNMDMFIRNSYFGGGTDVYKAYAEYVHYYDVNSLYPYAMLNPMPYNLISPGLISLLGRSLDSFFGFAEAEIFCPKTMLRPVLPFHKDGKTIYPTGTWKGVYFSEELKAVVKLGYQVTLLRGYEFSKTDLFSNYVKYFYEIKRLAKGAERNMVKLQLNNLYGYFGRKQITISTQNIKNDQLQGHLITQVVKSVTPITNEYSTILTYSNINYSLLEKLNNELHYDIKSYNSLIKSNVAIAAAVTAYARIIMIPFKIDPNTLYTDTDSAFTSKPIDLSLIGDGLGQLKDELGGQIIREAYFLGPKKYGYYIIDENGCKKDYSVFAGVPRNSLTFDEVKAIFNGETLTKNISNRFYKSFNTLNIDVRDTKISIKNNPNNKMLVDNNYLPPTINSGYNSLFGYLFNKFRNIIIRNKKNK